jgi:hypothetical protein
MKLKIRNIIVLSIFIFSIFSCEKNKWKLPTKVSFSINLNNLKNERFSFTEGYIVISNFEIQGRRDQGNDVISPKKFGNGLKIQFNNSNVSDLDFDIPQGTYNNFEVIFDTQLCETAGNNNPDNYLAGLRIKGTLLNIENENCNVIFEFNMKEYFNLIAKNPEGNSQIILDTEIPSFAKIIFNPAYWFQNISDLQIQNIEYMQNNGQTNFKTILINEENNQEIYSIVANRIKESTTFVISN